MPERTPEQWLEHLLRRLDQRRPSIQQAKAYYEGRHNLAFATDKFREAFGGLFREFADNWCQVVVQAPAERMRVQGIRLANDEAYDKDAWDMWQRNELDSWSAVHHTSTLSTGYGYILVWADEDGSPRITIEDAEQVIVDYDPMTGRRAAGLKAWIDEVDGHGVSYLYLPDGIYKFRTKKKGLKTKASSWEPLESADEAWPLTNPLKQVPIVEFLNDPSISRTGRSEIRGVIPVQNAINKLVADLLVASEFTSWRQRYIVGWTPETDPETGLPLQDQLKQAMARIMAFADKDVKPGEFSETNLKNFVDAIEMLVHHLAAQSRTPRHYFFQTGQSPSGDAIKSAETGLVAKVLERMLHYGERHEEVIRLGFAVLNDGRANETSAETRWADPEYRTEGELTDAVIKQYQAKLIPWQNAVERLGYSPQDVNDMKGRLAAERMMEQAVNLSTLAE